MAPSPSSRGISGSSVTTSGLCWCTLLIASRPSRAVATTRNSAPRTSTSTRRISALSSATTTLGRPDASDDVGIDSHRPDLYPAVCHVKPHAAATVAAHRLTNDRDGRGAERGARGQDVALAHLDGAGRDELAEHAGAAGQLCHEPPRVRPERLEPLDEQRHGGFRELGAVREIAGEAGRRQ